MRHPAIILTIIIALGVAGGDFATAQSFPVSDLTTLIHSGPDALDDIVVLPTGEIVASLPGSSAIGVLDVGTSTTFVPLPLPPVTVVGMELGPDGRLYLGDAISHSVLAYDFVSGVTTTVQSGFFVPLDIVFRDPTTLYVVDLTSPDFFGGVCNVHELQLSGGVAVSDTIIVANIPGAADVELSPDGQTLYVGSLGSPVLGAVDLQGGPTTTLGFGVLLATDIVVVDGGQTLLVSTLYQSAVHEVDTTTGAVTTLVRNLATGNGGAEDLAVLPSGDILVSINSGAIHRLDRSSPLRQVGLAARGQTFALRFDRPTAPNWRYALFLSGSANVGVPVPTTSLVLPVDPDPLLIFTSFPRPPGLASFDGFLDAAGAADIAVAIPSFAIVGFQVYFAGFLFAGPTAPPSTWEVTNAVRVTIAP